MFIATPVVVDAVLASLHHSIEPDLRSKKRLLEFVPGAEMPDFARFLSEDASRSGNARFRAFSKAAVTPDAVSRGGNARFMSQKRLPEFVPGAEMPDSARFLRRNRANPPLEGPRKRPKTSFLRGFQELSRAI